MAATPEDNGPLVGDYLVGWLARREGRLRPSSFKSYRQVIGCYPKPHLVPVRTSGRSR